MRRFKFLVVFLLCLFLFGCSFTPQKPAGQAILTKYESVVPQEVKDLDVYKKALKQNSVIVYNGTVITDVQTVKDFLSDIENKKDAQLHCYEFNENTYDGKVDKWIVYKKVYTENNKIMLQTFYSKNDEPEKWTEIDDEGDTEETKKINMSDYGMLYYHDEKTKFDDAIIPIMNYDEVPSNKIDYEKAKELEEKYFNPLWYEFVCGYTFDNIYDIKDWFNLFDDLYYYKYKSDFSDIYGEKIPMNDFMALLNEYFDVDKQTVINTFPTFDTVQKHYDENGNLEFSGTYYDKSIDSLVLGTYGRGGAGFCWIITDCKEEGENLTIFFNNCDLMTHVPRENYELKVKLMDDGTFRYISCIQVD